MNRAHVKWIGITLSIVVAIVVFSLLLTAKPQPSSLPVPIPSPTDQPKITWSASSVQPILSPGESSSTALSFVSSGGLTNVTVEAVPEIAPFVTIRPSTFASVPAGQTQPIQITFSIPQGTTLGTYDGTIHVRAGSVTFPQTLKVTINVWQAFSNSTLGINLKLPPGWTVSMIDDTRVGFLPPGKSPNVNDEYVGDIVAETFPNSSQLNLTDFYRQGVFVNLFSNSQSNLPFSTTGKEAVKFLGVFGMVPTDTISINLGTSIVEISDIGQMHENDRVFDSVAKTLN